MDSAVGTIVVLVHGTFARRAEWTRPTSKLCQGVIDNIPGEKSITAFSWSGRNSPTARYHAALQLRAELQRLAAEHPGWDIVVIGHSHGGTVAVRAVDCDELRSLAAVVCLSTPFLQAFPRNLPNGVFTQLGGALALLIATLVNPGLPFSHFLHIPQLVLPGYLTPLARTVNTLIFLATIAGVLLLLAVLGNKADKVAAQVMHVPRLPPSNVLLLRVAGDEASSWISVFQVLSWLSSKISRVYATAASTFNDRLVSISKSLRGRFDAFRHDALQDESIYLSLSQPTGTTEVFGREDEDDSPLSGMWLYGAGMLALLCILAAFVFDLGSSAWAYLWRGVFGAAGLVLGLTVLGKVFEGEDSLAGVLFLPILVPLALVSACFSVLGGLGFGLGTGLLVFFYEVSVEGSPIGEWQIRLLLPKGAGLIYHSQIYENPDALSEIYKWITGRKTARHLVLTGERPSSGVHKRQKGKAAS